MNRRMKSLWSHWWTYALIGTTIPLVPFVVSRMQKPPHSDFTKHLEEWFRAENTKDPRPDKTAEIIAFNDRWKRMNATAAVSDVLTIFKFTAVTQHPKGKESLQSLNLQIGQLLEDWDAIARDGRFSGVTAAKLAKPSDPTDNGFMVSQMVAKVEAAQARAAISDGDWDTCLRNIERVSRVTAPNSSGPLINQLVAVAVRAIADGALEDLARSNAPESIDQRALAFTKSLRASDPDLSTTSMLMGTASYYVASKQTSNPGTSWFLENSPILMGNARAMLARNAKLVKDPSAVKWLKEESGNRTLGGAFYQPTEMRWTWASSLRVRMTRLMTLQPDLPTLTGFPAELTDSLTPYERVELVGSLMDGANMSEALSRTRVVATTGRLLEASFAARLYHRQHGDWPGDLKDLAEYGIENIPPSYADELEHDDTGKKFAVYGPMGMGMVPIGPGNLETFLGSKFKGLLGPTLHDKVWRGGMLTGGFGSGSESYMGFRAGDRVRELPDDRIRLTLVVRPESSDTIPAREGTFRLPLLYACERLVTDPKSNLAAVSFQLTATESVSFTAEGKDQAEQLERRLSGTGAHERITSVTYEMEFPKQAFAIWCPGPKGPPAAGWLAYSPTNGTFSAGDLIIFPEL